MVTLPITKVIPDDRHLIWLIEDSQESVKFSLQKQGNERQEFEIARVSPFYDYSQIIAIFKHQWVQHVIALQPSAITELLQIPPEHHISINILLTRNPYQEETIHKRGDIVLQYVNITNGINAIRDYIIPELPHLNPDILFVAESGKGDLENPLPSMNQVAKIGKWGLQVYARGQVQVLNTYEDENLLLTQVVYQGFTITGIYIPPQTEINKIRKWTEDTNT